LAVKKNEICGFQKSIRLEKESMTFHPKQDKRLVPRSRGLFCGLCKQRFDVLLVVPRELLESIKAKTICCACDTAFRRKYEYQLEVLYKMRT